MISPLNWEPCVNHRGDQAKSFLQEFFSQEHRHAILVAGSGFDPRALTVARLLAGIPNVKLRGFFLREDRPDPDPELLARANKSQEEIIKLVPVCEVAEVKIFAQDGAVVGGREIVKLGSGLSLDKITDLVVDVSALSVGIIYPLVRYLLQRISKSSTPVNLHLVLIDNPVLDQNIVSIGNSVATVPHGFKGGFRLSETMDAAKLWMPHLVLNQASTLRKIYSFINPDYVCPIVPFPSRNPRFGDELLEHYEEELIAWGVDHRNIVYAAESDPLDVYRTILQIDSVQSRVFKEVGGSLTIVSPLGSKLLAVGALMAAIERDFPIVSVESISYKLNGHLAAPEVEGDIVHIWLSGEAYSYVNERRNT